MKRELRILMLEDSAKDADLLERELRKGGLSFSVVRVDAREPFLREIKEFKPDVIIADYALPSFDGLRALELVRERSSELPFILVSGAIGEERAIEALKMGATDFILKDRLGRLASCVHKSLREAEERAERREIEQEKEESQRELHSANIELERLAQHLAMARDVAERANRAKSRFLAGMSHEMRTPLNGILGYARLLHMEGGLNSGQTARVDAMLGAGKHLLEMITCVLDLSEIEAGHVQLHPVEIDLEAVAAACLDLVRPMAETKELALRIILTPGTPRKLSADPTRLRQILFNLLGNAAKFTSQGKIDLRLRTLADCSTLRVEVADTGPGISAEQRQHLFRDFERLDTETTRAVEGAGLGLALSARLANLMGGRLGHDDNPGGGSVFWLELPLDTVAKSTRAMAPGFDVPDGEVMQAPGRILHVLVVDDVLMNRDIASSFLRAAGHEVTCVEGGAEAVASVFSADFDVVLMDVRMPEMDGIEATRRIRALEGARGRVPIVALTAQAFSDQIAECHKAGMGSHLAKPFDPDTLLAAAVQAAGARPAHDRCLNPVTIPNTAAPVVIPMIGSELLVFNPAAFECTARFLAQDEVATYLGTIAEHCEVLLRDLREPDAITRAGGDLGEAAHTLAGTAGMFGFDRLIALARRFEEAIASGSAETPALADGLSAALEATILTIHERTSVGS